MSSILRIEKKELDQLVSALLSDYQLFGPVNVDGAAVFREVKSAEELALGTAAIEGSAKAVFFPQTETLLTYGAEPAAAKRDEVSAQVPSGRSKPIAVIGARPCDAKGLELLNRVFSTGDFRDSFWQRRYENRLVIAVSCNSPCPTCFCNWLNLGPTSPESSDVMLTDIGDAYVAESTSDLGERFLKNAYRSRVQRPSEEDLNTAARVREQAQSMMTPVPERLRSTPDRPLVERLASEARRAWDSPLWDELALQCLSCAACAYLCPTCHCFDIQDERDPGTNQGRRIRIWDTCMAPLFTKEASGHNPRARGRERLRQRIMHKFSYFVDTYHELGCVGCGRCIRMCPAGLDLRRVLERIVGPNQREDAK